MSGKKSLKIKERQLKGRVAVVTGADGGIGLEFCKCLAGLGMQLVMVSNRERELADAASMIASEYDVDTLALTQDLRCGEAPRRILEAMKERGLEPYVLINNAGIFSFDYVTETPEGKIDAFVNFHVRSVTHMSRLFAAEMARLGGGYILNMSSMSCWMPMPGLAMYASTKAYIRAFTRALHYEMRESGVAVMAACPGGIATDLFGLPANLQRLAVRLGVLERPGDFVRKAVKRLIRGKAQYINGLLNRISIVAVGSTPRCVRMLVKHKLLDAGIRK